MADDVQVQYEPLTSFFFSLEIEGIDTGYFTSVEGLSIEFADSNTTIQTPGSAGKYTRIKVPGRVSYGDITLKRPVTGDSALYDWIDQIRQGGWATNRKTGSIVRYNQAGEEKERWNFSGAWPKKYTIPSGNADDDNVAMEELVLSVDYLERGK